ncbi:hypothetical protein TeGR_g6793 [Tetraparma gracilis]|uniref:Rhodanese domain-containing protein n=1 Tax=Tetraparma gracilis TaxID=2962635 RepID=A0ABQ6MUZ0_9STRA|nr:hypothetical protein TeGR_g6793 [Tetraparma gracilis]
MDPESGSTGLRRRDRVRQLNQSRKAPPPKTSSVSLDQAKPSSPDRSIFDVHYLIGSVSLFILFILMSSSAPPPSNYLDLLYPAPIPALLTKFHSRLPPSTPSPVSLSSLLPSNTPSVPPSLLLVDCRTAPEIATSTIPSLPSPPLPSLVSRILSTSPTLHPLTVVPFCTIGYRSGLLCNQLLSSPALAPLLSSGALVVKNGAGVVPWSHEPAFANLLVRPGTGEPTRELHVFGEEWDHPGPGFVAVRFAQGRPGWLGMVVGGWTMLRERVGRLFRNGEGGEAAAGAGGKDRI